MLEETGITTQEQEMQVAATVRNKLYISFFSNRLAETGSTMQRAALLTAVNCKCVAKPEVLSFPEIVRGKGAALQIPTD